MIEWNKLETMEKINPADFQCLYDEATRIIEGDATSLRWQLLIEEATEKNIVHLKSAAERGRKSTYIRGFDFVVREFDQTRKGIISDKTKDAFYRDVGRKLLEKGLFIESPTGSYVLTRFSWNKKYLEETIDHSY